MALNSLKNIHELLNPGGQFFLQELFFESYLKPSISRSIIFQICKLKKHGFNIPFKDFVDDLEVCFYTREELILMLKKSGFIIQKKWDFDFMNSLSKEQSRKYTRKLILLKNWGNVAFLAQK